MKKKYILILLCGLFFFSQIMGKVQTKTMYVHPKTTKVMRKISPQIGRDTFHNKDIMGYIEIEGTNIQNYFTKTTDNNFYLTHDLAKKKSIFGSIFMDYRNEVTDAQVNLYGHNGNHKDAPFYALSQYKKKEFYDSHKTITLYTDDKIIDYEIVYIMITQTEDHMNIKAPYAEKKAFYEENTLYDTGLSIDEKDILLVLQTCTYEQKDSFLLVVAKKRKENVL